MLVYFFRGKKLEMTTGLLCRLVYLVKKILDSLGFTLEPNSLEAPPYVYDDDPPSLCETSPGMIS